MSWVGSNNLTEFQKFCIKVLKCGPVPNHIAIIMDGNRRYAKKTNVQKAVGHSKGFEKLAECLHWCRELGIKEVTVYAFSIENFKRSPDEVDALMELAKEKFRKIFEEKDKLMQEGVCIRVIGNLSLLPEDLRKLIAEAALLTENNTKSILNVAFSYTSREEMTYSLKTILQGIKDGLIDNGDVSEELISSCLYTQLSRNPEILIRTSGESRLSDFLLWQISDTDIYFTDVLWPEFSIWHLLGFVFKYQRQYNTKSHDVLSPQVLDHKIQTFVEQVKIQRRKQLEIYSML
ncbi:dehydrodolichyl diphosphate synthase complex subunit DHDDS [Diorhabda sublineata]|uniref:dehydrodolichyl diphosphate synthase complex subunit DHDDS n=1 Tax=Diorhabda sublineata TaxID=1163346 RepID=UPI0024E119D1|nr:dehydrodolichyl diphosphate synthase complex subunit DHDDS [Diorhabda sublineata]